MHVHLEAYFRRGTFVIGAVLSHDKQISTVELFPQTSTRDRPDQYDWGYVIR